ncbi:polysaccharide deacetylase family protein [Mariniflexile soesokkakense]|uniref:Polysaccharide deacetylase family protein n=1 Tax=Mariniflexile soesokkakense TaxID=1343160 RepID=A0ABV0A8G2_9FLAO
MRKRFILIQLIFVSFFGYSQILKKAIPDKLVVLTFDDGCVSHYTFVAPLLKKYNFNATFFMCEFPPNYKDSTKYMTWSQVKGLSDMGFEVGNHTLSHAKINKITNQEYKEQVQAIEIKCDSIGISKPTSFAYPAYDLNASALQILMETDYKFARAGGSRAYNPLEDHPFLLPSWAMKSDNKNQIIEAFNEAKNGNIVVITIHGVPDIEHPWVNTPPELFEAYLQYLNDNDFNVISIKDLDNYINTDIALKTIVPDLNKKLKG